MSKRSKRIKKRINSSIDDKYIDSYVNKDNQPKADSLFKYDIIGKLSLRGSKITETRKSKHFKNKNSPEIAKLKKLKRKILLSDNMLLDAVSTNNTTNINTNNINNINNDLKNINAHQNDKEVDDIWNDSIYDSIGKKINKIKNINQLIPAVELPHPGQSYNPNPDDYVSLINHSVNIIQSNKKDETTESELNKENRNIFERSSVLNSEKMDNDQLNGLDSSSDIEEMKDNLISTKRIQKRKTKTERNKLKVRKEESKRKMVIKSIKKLKNDVDHIKKINTTINNSETNKKYQNKLQRFKNYLNKLIMGEIPTKISNKMFFNDPPEVVLNEELIKENENLNEQKDNNTLSKNISIKNIQNVNENPIKNVYKSIYRRGLLPPPPIINSRYKNLIKKLYKKRYIYKAVLSK